MSTLKSTLAQRRKHDEGFTLIELMVVVMIIAVLMAIAIPTFLGSQNKAKDRSAQSSLRNTVTAAKTIFTDSTSYTTVTNVTLLAAEPSLTFQALPATVSSGPKNVALGTPTATVFYAAALSDSGTCYYIKDDIAAGTTYSKSSTGADCTGTKALAPTVAYSATGWS
jgi:type IV pilus assembly protein PilA